MTRRKRRKERSWKRAGCYVWRTRKPHAWLGISLRWLLLAALLIGTGLYLAGGWWWVALVLPFFSGRHTAYVGQTSSRYFRDQQHLRGSTKYGSTGKPWADLDPKCYPLPAVFVHWRWARLSQETLWTGLLWPVYSVEKNRWNPRRITPASAQAQRASRDALGLRVNVGRMIGRGTVVLGFWAVIGFGVWEAWR